MSLLESSFQGWWYLYSHGGVVVVLLFVASLIGLAIILEKIIRLKRSRVFEDSSAINLLLSIKKHDNEQLAVAKQQAPRPMAEMVDSAQTVKDLPREDMISEMSAVASMHLRQLSSRLRLLGILASISPLLGLLGTVIGMISAMGEVSLGAGADPGVVGTAISQALLTTAVGLSVGIPLLIAHSLLKDRINRYSSEFEEFGHEVMKAFHYPDSLTLEDSYGEKGRSETSYQKENSGGEAPEEEAQ
jgi:biopolymer transport protein ExbB